MFTSAGLIGDKRNLRFTVLGGGEGSLGYVKAVRTCVGSPFWVYAIHLLDITEEEEKERVAERMIVWENMAQEL